MAKETEWKLKDEAFRDIVGVFGMPDIFLLLVLMQNGTASPAMGKDFSGSRSLIREALRSGSVSEEVLQICLASICESAVKQYNAGLKLWWSYRKSKGLDIFSATIPEILAFFTMHFQNGASIASLNSFRAELAQILKPDIILDFRIKRFFVKFKT